MPIEELMAESHREVKEWTFLSLKLNTNNYFFKMSIVLIPNFPKYKKKVADF